MTLILYSFKCQKGRILFTIFSFLLATAALCFAFSAISSIEKTRERVCVSEEAKALVMAENPNPAFEKGKNLPAGTLSFDYSDLDFITLIDPLAERIPVFDHTLANDFRTYFLSTFPQVDGHNLRIYVVDPGYFKFFKIEAIHGRTFESDDLRRTNLIVINNALRKELFGEGKDGDFLEIASINYQIVGVVDDYNRGFNFELTGRHTEPSVIYILPPPGLAREGYAKIIFKFSSPEILTETIDLISAQYRMFKPEKADRVVFQSFSEYAETIIGEFTQGATVFFVFSLALFLSAEIGLFGMFFLFNKTRIRNLCLKLVCGASRKAVFTEVLFEFLFISLIGTMLGGLSARLLVHAVNVVLSPPIVITVNYWLEAGVLLGINALTIGLALYPAYRAAQSNPAEVLRAL